MNHETELKNGGQPITSDGAKLASKAQGNADTLKGDGKTHKGMIADSKLAVNTSLNSETPILTAEQKNALLACYEFLLSLAGTPEGSDVEVAQECAIIHPGDDNGEGGAA
jgi:hypothetical protein